MQIDTQEHYIVTQLVCSPQNDELLDFIFIRLRKDFTVIKLERMRWAGHIACTGNKIISHGVLVRRPEGKRTLRRARNVWEDNTKMDV
jgi:hypothetical protein